MKKLHYAFVFLLGLAGTLPAQTALFVDTTITPQQMIEDFFNTAQVTVSNVAFTGSPAAAGYFEAANTDLDLLAGIMLSSGQAALASNPADFFASASNGTSGDADIQALAGGAPSFDAAALEFDLLSQTDTLCFIYRFASEEYPEYACSSFNDLFAFWVSGPGYPQATNIAVLPDSSALPVSINNIHAANPVFADCDPFNEQYYVDYQAGTDAAYDGFTVTLPAKFVTLPGETYHVKIALSDVADGIFDSGVFIAINSLGGDSLLVPVAEMAAPPIVDGTTVTFANGSRYGTAWHWDFGDGTTSNERHPGAHTYPQFGPDGDSRATYEVTLITTNYCCADTVKTTVEIGSSGVTAADQPVFALSPNPAADYVIVQPAEAGAFTVRVTDLNGRLLYAEKTSGAARIEMANWPAGFYTLELRQDKRVARQRFVKK